MSRHLTSLTKFTISELEDELDRRRYPRPEMLSVPQLMPLAKHLEHGIAQIATTGRPTKDFQRLTSEFALEAFYGRDVWDWLHEKCVDGV